MASARHGTAPILHKSGKSGEFSDVHVLHEAPASPTDAFSESRTQMATKSLSNREAEIVELATQGLTNEAIALRLRVSIGTINTYWARIKFKTGGASRTDTVARIVGDRGEQALRQADTDHAGIERVIQAGMTELIRERETDLFNWRAAVGMLELISMQTQITVWAADTDLRIQIIVNPQASNALPLAIGKTVQEVLGTRDPSHPGLAGHLDALQGKDSAVTLGSDFHGSFLRTAPLLDDTGAIIGCIGSVTLNGPQPNSAQEHMRLGRQTIQAGNEMGGKVVQSLRPKGGGAMNSRGSLNE